MAIKVAHDYDPDLDVLHIYSEKISEGVKGSLSVAEFNIDISNDNRVVGVEIEEASKILRLDPKIIESPDEVQLLVRHLGNFLFIGARVVKGKINSFIQVPTPLMRLPQSIKS